MKAHHVRLGTRIQRTLVALLVAQSIVTIYIACFGVPNFLMAWMTCADSALSGTPDYVVVLGGGGIPSESGLIRCYYGADLYPQARTATFVVSLPSEGDPSTNSVGRMRDELIMRGVPSNQIVMEYKALNTHEQAVCIAQMLGPASLTSHVHIVTSPVHSRRSVACFTAAGFRNITASAAKSIGAEADPGPGTWIRYGLWGQLRDGVDFARECVSLLAYKLRGWI